MWKPEYKAYFGFFLASTNPPDKVIALFVDWWMTNQLGKTRSASFNYGDALIMILAKCLCACLHIYPVPYIKDSLIRGEGAQIQVRGKQYVRSVFTYSKCTCVTPTFRMVLQASRKTCILWHHFFKKCCWVCSCDSAFDPCLEE
jgi:hypothetical protein